MVLEKTLESPLDCKEIQPVHSEGDQSWVFIGRTDAEAETPVLWCICSGMPLSWPSSSLTLLLGWLLMFLLPWCHHCFLQVTGNCSSSLVALLGNLLEFNSLLGESMPTQMNTFADLGSAPLRWLLMCPGAYQGHTSTRRVLPPRAGPALSHWLLL